MALAQGEGLGGLDETFGPIGVDLEIHALSLLSAGPRLEEHGRTAS